MKKRVSGIILAGVMLLSTSFSFAQNVSQNEDITTTAGFTDISKHWSKDAVQGLLELGAIPYTTDAFNPSKAITRSEFALMLRNAIGIKLNYFVAPEIKDYFNDVKQDSPYALALVDLVTLNILEKGGSFNPDGTISREEMTHYVMSAYKKMMGDKYAMIKINPASFADVDTIKPEYSGEVARAQHYKLISGTGNNLFQPKSNATRGQAAVVIYKMLGLVEEQNQVVSISANAEVNSDSIDMIISIVNNTKKDVVLNHSSGQKFDFKLFNSTGEGLYTWSADKSFIAALTSTKIEAGKSLEFKETLSGEQYKAIKDKIAYMKAFITGQSDSVNVNTEGYDVNLK